MYNGVFGYGDDAEQPNPYQGGHYDAPAELLHTVSNAVTCLQAPRYV